MLSIWTRRKLSFAKGLNKYIWQKGLTELLIFQSVGICFIGKRKFHDFIEEYVEPSAGDVVHHETGEILCKHDGRRFCL